MNPEDDNSYGLPVGSKIIYDPKRPVPFKEDLPKGARIIQPKKQNELMEENENDLEREAERQRGQITSRMLETVLGMPGDLAELFQKFTGIGMQDIPFTPEESKKAGLQPGEGFQQKPTKTLPTSKDLREFSEKYSQGYTKPKNEFEEKGGQFAAEVAGRIPFGPGGILGTLLAPVVGNIAFEGLKKAGVKEEKARKAKMGLELALDLATGNGRQAGIREIERARQAGRGLSVNVTPITNQLNNLRNTWRTSLRSRAAENPAVRIAQDLEEAATNGRLTANSILDARLRVNDARKDLGHFTALPTTRTQGSIGLNELDNILNQAVDRMAQVNPRFGEHYRAGNEALTAVNRSNVIENFISKNYVNPFVSKAAHTLFSGGTAGTVASHGLGHLAGIGAKTAGVGAGLGTTYQAMKILYRVAQSPVLRRHYTGVLTNAAKNQVKPMKHHMEKLDEELKELEDKGEI